MILGLGLYFLYFVIMTLAIAVTYAKAFKKPPVKEDEEECPQSLPLQMQTPPLPYDDELQALLARYDDEEDREDIRVAYAACYPPTLPRQRPPTTPSPPPRGNWLKSWFPKTKKTYVVTAV